MRAAHTFNIFNLHATNSAFFHNTFYDSVSIVFKGVVDIENWVIQKNSVDMRFRNCDIHSSYFLWVYFYNRNENRMRVIMTHMQIYENFIEFKKKSNTNRMMNDKMCKIRFHFEWNAVSSWS